MPAKTRAGFVAVGIQCSRPGGLLSTIMNTTA
jgi:hypothetical protein